MQITALTNEEFQNILREIKQIKEIVASNKQRNHLYDNADVMKMLKVSLRTLSTWRENGTLKYSKVGAKIYYKQEHLDEMIAKGMVDSCNDTQP